MRIHPLAGSVRAIVDILGWTACYSVRRRRENGPAEEGRPPDEDRLLEEDCPEEDCPPDEDRLLEEDCPEEDCPAARRLPRRRDRGASTTLAED